MRNIVQVATRLEADRLQKLKILRKITRVPTAARIREGIDMILIKHGVQDKKPGG